MNRIFSSFILLLLAMTGTQLQAQLITANPTFPTDQNQVVITFDASLGSAGLAGYTGDVYAHTGVITDKSNSNSDWKYVVAAWTSNIPKAKMTRIAPDLYTLTLGPSIREYYGVPASDEILKLAFVFRSSDPVNGSYLEGKTAENGDIFYDVYEPGLNVIFVQPDQKLVLAEPQQIIPFSIASIDADSTVLFINNVKVASTTAQQLSYQYTAAATGSVVVKATAYATSAQL
ncbi:MAG TPA: Por secretion system protein, partial [Bacteroidales bacterium]|nr:Por secretion system protein [Bacteroidales bacterium]